MPDEKITECVFIGGPMHGRTSVHDGDFHQNLPDRYTLVLDGGEIGSSERVGVYFLYAEHELEDELFAIYVADSTRKQRIYDFICDHEVLGSSPQLDLDVYV